MDPLLVLIAIIAVLVGVGIGGNSAPKACGLLQCVLALNYRQLACLLAVFIFLGGVLQAHGISNTIGKGLLPPDTFTRNLKALAAVFVSVGLIALALNVLGIPSSISQIMVSCVIGVGASLGILGKMQQSILAKIMASWILTPFAAGAIAYMIYRFIIMPLGYTLNIVSYNRLFVSLTLIGVVFISYDIGANNVGVILGPLIGADLFDGASIWGFSFSSSFLLSVFFGLILGVGALLLGGPVSYTLGKRITSLDPMSSFSSQLGAGIVVYVFIVLGIPVSMGQAIVGGISGVGLVKGMHILGNKTMKKILFCWFATPVASFALSLLIYRIIIIV
ncbi:MAG: inorganic phosphate transporter [Candidatus Altiarchaeota archaeon]